jgi:hypothetical protein
MNNRSSANASLVRFAKAFSNVAAQLGGGSGV